MKPFILPTESSDSNSLVSLGQDFLRLTRGKHLRAMLIICAAIMSMILGNEVKAERCINVSLGISSIDSKYVGKRDEYPATNSGALVEADYSNTTTIGRSLSTYIDPECAGTLAVVSMTVDGPGAQVLYAYFRDNARAPFFVLSPCLRNVFNEYANNGPATLTFRLAGEKPWRLKAIGLDVVNYDEYAKHKFPETHNGETGATGVMKVNGHEVTLEKDYNPYSIRIDLAEDERDVTEIKIEAEAKAAVAFRKITLFLEDEKAEFIELDNEPRATTPEYSFSGIYRIPYCKIGQIDDPTRMACAVFNSAGNRMNITATPVSGEPYFELSSNGEGEDELEEGDYRAVFYLPDGQFDNYEPSPEDGAEFSILPTAYGMYLNWAPVDFSKDIFTVPSHTTAQDSQGQVIQYDWEHVLLNGLRPGTTVYWKVSGDPNLAAPDPAENGVAERPARKAPTTIPSDYQKMQNLTVDLSKGNQLSLILNKNGVNSYPIDIQYQRYDVPTAIDAISDDNAAEGIFTEWYDMQGNQVANPQAGSFLIRVCHYPDGHTSSEKILYR